MSSNRRFLLAAVGVTLSTPALAREAEKPARIEPVATEVEAPTEEVEAIPAWAADSYEVGFLDLSMCELTTANTKGPSYDAKCLARLNDK